MMSEHGSSKVAAFIAAAIERSDKTQLEISAEAGFPRSSVLSMIKQGQTKMPLARIPQMARALDVDPVEFFRLAMAEYMPELLRICDDVYNQPQLSDAEAELLRQLRTRLDGKALRLTPRTAQALARFVETLNDPADAASDGDGSRAFRRDLS